MPLFGRKSPGEPGDRDAARRTAERAAAEQQANVAALEAGGIPLHAQRRLAEMRERRSSFFTSDLSVSEFLLSREGGFTPLSQVMGSSIYHVGWQRMPGQSMWYRGTEELAVVSTAMNTARERALDRLRLEAAGLGAHAVTGLHVTRSRYDWGRDLIEFTAIGTAVTLHGAEETDAPILTNLSGQDFWKLHRSGYTPSGIVASSTVFYVVGGRQVQWGVQSWAAYANQEMTDFTNGVYAARFRVMGNVTQQARECGASGVVGVQIEHDIREQEVEGPNESRRQDLIVTFHVIGTGISESDAVDDTTMLAPVVQLKP